MDRLSHWVLGWCCRHSLEHWRPPTSLRHLLILQIEKTLAWGVTMKFYFRARKEPTDWAGKPSPEELTSNQITSGTYCIVDYQLVACSLCQIDDYLVPETVKVLRCPTNWPFLSWWRSMLWEADQTLCFALQISVKLPGFSSARTPWPAGRVAEICSYWMLS